MVSDYQMRVSDTEREAAATELREHYAAGRLTLEELDERLDKAFAAKTRGDLNALMTDLPSARQGPAGARTAGSSGPFGADGPFGPNGPFGASGPFGPGGPGGPYGSRRADWGAGRDWRDGSGWNRGPTGRGTAHAIGAIMTNFVVVSALLLLGILGVFGIGAGRPFAIVLILAALALLRRLLFRRRVRTSRGCGPRGRRW